jgi:integrase/recombinase XerD
VSGGPFGRGKAPERACMPIAGWPALDRQRWLAACKPADILSIDESGARSRLSQVSNRKAEKGYGRWLTYIAINDPSALWCPPETRITPERVRAYVEALQTIGNGTATVLARLQELTEMAKVMGPNTAWGFINRIASKVRATHRPVRDKSNLRLSDELLDLGLCLIEQAAQVDLTQRQAAIMHRDGLIIAFLSLVPLRRRNLARLTIGANLINVGGAWLIILEAAETKTQQFHEVFWPDIIVSPLHTYLDKHRPCLVRRSGRWLKVVGDSLWVSSHGSPMTEIAIYDRIRSRTEEAFGRAVNPHLFRDAAATTLAIADPAHVRIAAPLLGHRTFMTTERYYQQAQGYEAHCTFIEAIFGEGPRHEREN